MCGIPRTNKLAHFTCQISQMRGLITLCVCVCIDMRGNVSLHFETEC